MATLGVTLQVLQSEDSTPAYRYFTIWSAVMVGLYGAGIFSRIKRLDAFACTCGSAGAVFSGAVYLVAIAPVNGIGHELATIAANVVLHVVLPIVVVLLYSRQRDRLIPPRGVVIALGFPAAYLVYSLLASRLVGTAPAYAFLDAAEVGRLGVLFAVVGGAVVYSLVVWLLSRLPGDGVSPRRD